jgi:hypothetical protein
MKTVNDNLATKNLGHHLVAGGPLDGPTRLFATDLVLHERGGNRRLMLGLIDKSSSDLEIRHGRGPAGSRKRCGRYRLAKGIVR